MSEARDAGVAEKLLAIALETAAASDEEVFGILVRALARAFEVPYAMVGQVLEEPAARVRSLAVWANEALADPVECELAGTPFEAVRDTRVCLFSDHIQEKFPAAALLKEMGAASYLGVPLIGSSGQVLGVLALMDVKPMTWSGEESRSLLEIVAKGAAGALERQRLTSALCESKERYRAIFERSPALVYVHDLNGVFIDANDATLRALGYRRDEIPSLKFADIIPEDQLAKALEGIEETRAHGSRSEPREYRLTAKDGSTRIVRTTGSLLNRDGKPYAILGIGEDITEHVRVDEATRESNERFGAAFHASPDAVTLSTVDDEILVDVNEGFCSITGYRRDEVVGRRMLDLSLFSSLEDRGRSLEEIARRGALDNYRIDFRRKDGGIILGLLSVRVVKVGGRAHFLAITRDITEQVALARRTQEHEKLVAIGRVAAGIAHEVKNPLFAISSGLQLLMDELSLDEEQRETFEIIFKDIGRINRLVQQLQLMASRREPVRSEQRVADLVREAVTLNRGVFAEKSLRLVESFTPDLPSLWVDRDRVHQVVINLLQNAVSVSPNGGVIEIGAEYVADRRVVAIRVRDHGPGVSQELMPRIFEPFFTTKRNSAGLGLPICVSIAEEHGGSIEVRNHPDEGAVFSLVLPVETPI